MCGCWSTAAGSGDTAGCDGGSGGNRSKHEQRGGDDDVGERVDLWSGHDDGNVWGSGDGVYDADHYTPDSDIAEDKTVSSTGSYSATGTQTYSSGPG